MHFIALLYFIRYGTRQLNNKVIKMSKTRKTQSENMTSEHNAIFRLSTLFRLLKRRHSSDLWAFHFLSHHTPLLNAYMYAYECDTRAYLPRNLLILFFSSSFKYVYIFFVQSFVLFHISTSFCVIPIPHCCCPSHSHSFLAGAHVLFVYIAHIRDC